MRGSLLNLKNKPSKCDEMDYINFLLVAQQVLSSVKASQTNPEDEQAPALEACKRLLNLKCYGWVKVFRTDGTNGDAEYRATSYLYMTIEQDAFHALNAWQIGIYHRVLKQFTRVERGQYRLDVLQCNYIGLAIRAFVRLEAHRLQTGISWFVAKTDIIRSAMCLYLAHPTITLGSPA